jgi:hypothetical protein
MTEGPRRQRAARLAGEPELVCDEVAERACRSPNTLLKGILLRFL